MKLLFIQDDLADLLVCQGGEKLTLLTVTRRPAPPKYSCRCCNCLAHFVPGFLPYSLREDEVGIFYVHRVFLSYTRDQRLRKFSSERLGNENKAPCPRALSCRAGARTADLRYGSTIGHDSSILHCPMVCAKSRI